MKIKIRDRWFSTENNAPRQMRQNLLNNINKISPILNQRLKTVDKEREIFEINFSINLRRKKRTEVSIITEGLRDMKISISTPYSFGYSFSERKLKKILLASLRATLKYY